MVDISENVPNRIGIARGQNLCDADYDFDEMNPEIEKMFMEENSDYDNL